MDFALLSDEELAALTRSGDDESFEALLNRHEARIYTYALLLTGGNQGAAEEILGQVFLELYHRLKTGTDEAVAVEKSITHHCVTMALEIVQTESIVEKFSIPQAASVSALAAVDASGAVEDSAARSASGSTKVLYQAVSQLPQAFRTAFILRDVIGYSESDISSILMITQTEVQDRIRSARKHLTASITSIRSLKHNEKVLASRKTGSVPSTLR